mgnify:CR=1
MGFTISLAVASDCNEFDLSFSNTKVQSLTSTILLPISFQEHRQELLAIGISSYPELFHQTALYLLLSRTRTRIHTTI